MTYRTNGITDVIITISFEVYETRIPNLISVMFYRSAGARFDIASSSTLEEKSLGTL